MTMLVRDKVGTLIRKDASVVINRAYSVIEVKSVDEEKRIITGVATTPSPDRMGDIVEPLGVSFKNPLPLLWQHDSDKPVGSVTFDKPTAKGITFTATIAQLEEAGTLKDRLDEAWQSVKMKLVRAVSIGFRAIEYSWMDDGGIRFVKSEVLELSLVTIPANADAKIDLSAIKSIDGPLLALQGKEPKASDRPTPPAHGKSRKPVKLKGASTMTLAEMIAKFVAERAEKSARMNTIQKTAIDEGRTKSDTEKDEFDTLGAEIASIDVELKDLRQMEQVNLAGAVEIKGNSTEVSVQSRGGHAADQQHARVQVMPRRELAPGIRFTRTVMASVAAKGNPVYAAELFKQHERWMAETPELHGVLVRQAQYWNKSAQTPGDSAGSNWGGNALVNYQILTEEFINYLRPLTIIGRIPGLRRVPFKVKIGRQTGAATVGWVGEGAPKPVSSLAFDTVTLDQAKLAAIIVLNQELIRLANPSAELIVRDDLAAGIVQQMDHDFVDPSKAAVAGVSPASITNGVTPVSATGTTGAALRADMKTLLGNFLTANMQVTGVVVIMSQRLAMSIGLMTNSLGQGEFPGVSMNGGTFLNLPLITSENVPSVGGSPADGDPIIVASAPDILLADDGEVTIDASSEASLQMESAPDSPATASTTMVSLWQQNQTGIRAERYINWAKRRSTAVGYISNGKYFE